MLEKITDFLKSVYGLIGAIVLVIGALGALYGAMRSPWVKDLFYGEQEQQVGGVKLKKLEAERRSLEEQRKLEEEQERKKEVAHLAPGPSSEAQMKPGAEVPKTIISKLSPEGFRGQVQLTRLLSARTAKDYLETLDWKRYEAYKALITESGGGFIGRRKRDIPITDEPAIILVLKDKGWTADFHGQKLGFGKAQPMAGDVRKATLALLERELPSVYRAHIGGDEFEDLAVILMPQVTSLKATNAGNTIGIKVVGPETNPFSSYTVQFTR